MIVKNLRAVNLINKNLVQSIIESIILFAYKTNINIPSSRSNQK